MGNWNISIHGVGCHHNGKPEIDVESLTEDFVKVLQQRGHNVVAARCTMGSEVDVLEKAKVYWTPVEVIVNGKQVTIPPSASYQHVCEVAGISPDRNPSVTFSKAWGPFGKNGEGILTRGLSVYVKTGTVFSVAVTGNA